MAGLKGFLNKLLGKTERDSASARPSLLHQNLPAEASSASVTQTQDYEMDAGQTAAQLYEQVRSSAAPIDSNASEEELCGLHSEMTTEEIEQQLAYLYRRYNRAAASLNARMNREAEIMLDAIVAMRSRYLGK